jgi:hypothetical protein
MRRTQKQLEEEKIKYKVFEEDSKWYGFRNCPNCNNKLRYSSKESHILLRTIRNSESKNCICDTCNKTGEKNPFFGKKHKKETIDMISKNRKGKALGYKNSMSKLEHRKSVSIALKKKYDSGDLDFLKKIQSEKYKIIFYKSVSLLRYIMYFSNLNFVSEKLLRHTKSYYCLGAHNQR